MNRYTVKINGYQWQGQARNIGAAVRKAASVCGVSLNQRGVLLTINRGV